ncbi:MAG: methyltransferase [Chloroflexia bacterium]|nr:methyltransferase [Chloroflexia bacterium]
MPPDSPSGHDARIATLLASVRYVGPLHDERVRIPGTAHKITVLRPTDTDLLLDQVVDDPEQNLPYWAELWPSGIALAGAIAREPHLVRAAATLELGCGLGVTAAVALAAGARLTATDYAPEALTLTRLNTVRFAGAEPETRRLNWRVPDDPLVPSLDDDYAVVLAADVLYAARDVAPLLDLMERLLAPGGLLWLAEPGRRPAGRFLEHAARRGWSGPVTAWDGPWPDPKDDGITVRVHQLRRGGREKA